jgi:sodium/pantothenate symporter
MENIGDSYLFSRVFFCISLILFLWLSIRSSRVMSKGDDDSGFLLAGRSLGPFVGAATLVATGFSGWAFIGSPGVAYEYGTTEILANFMYAPAMVIAVIYFGGYLRNQSLKLDSNTIPEYIALLHAKGITARVIQGFAAVLTIILLTVFLIGQIKALGLIAYSVLGIPVTFSSILLLSSIIIYTMVGGMAAIAWTDTVMVIGMALGAIILMVIIFSIIDLTDLVVSLNAIDRELVSPTTGDPYGNSVISSFLVLPYALLFTLCLPYMANRIIAIRKDVSMQEIGIYVAILTCILSVTPIAGLYARAYLAPISEPDQAIISVIEQQVGPMMGALISIALLFAIKSTASSLLHTISSAASHDLRLAIIPGKELSTSRILFINRITVLFIGVLALVAMAYSPPFMLVWLGILGTGTLLASFSAPMILSSFWRGNGFGALAAMACGSISCGTFLLATDVGWVEGPLLACLFSAITYVIVSKLTFRIQPRIL